MSVEMVKLTELCRPKQWKTISGKDLLTEGYPVYGANGIIGYWSEYNHENETVTIACRGTCGSVSIVPAQSYINGNAMCLDNLSDKINLRFLYHYLRWFDFNSIITGTTIPQITIEGLQKVMVPCPSIEKQKELAHHFDIVEKLIVLRKEQLQKLDDLVKSRFVEMFGDPIHPTGFYALGEVATLERGRFSPRPRNDPKYYNGDYPFIQTGDIASCNHRLWNYTQTLNELGIKVSKKFDTGTIVMAIVGATIGATAILQREVYAPDSVVGITPHTYNNIFLESLLQFWRPELLATAPESARANINLSILGSIPIVRANQSQQQAFSDFVFQIDKTKLTVQQGLDKLELLKQSLMQKYFG